MKYVLLLLLLSATTLFAAPTPILTLQIPTGGGSSPNGTLEVFPSARETIDLGGTLVVNGTLTLSSTATVIGLPTVSSGSNVNLSGSGTLNIGSGGTLGSAAYTSSSAYDATGQAAASILTLKTSNNTWTGTNNFSNTTLSGTTTINGTLSGSAFGSGVASALAGTPSGVGSLVLSNSPIFTGIPTFNGGTTGASDYAAPQALYVGYADTNSSSNLAASSELAWTVQPGDTGGLHIGFLSAGFAYGANSSNGAAIGIRSVATARGTGVVNTITGFDSHIGSQTTGSGSVTNSYNFRANTPDAGTSLLTSSYGIYIDTQKVTGVANGYGIYQSGLGDLNIFTGLTRFFGGLDVPGGTLVVDNGGPLSIDSSGNITTTGQIVINTSGISTKLIQGGLVNYSSSINNWYAGIATGGGSSPDGNYHLSKFDGSFGDALTLTTSGSLTIPGNLSALGITATGSITQGGNPVANLTSPAFTGIPSAPTATAGTNTTQLATTAFVATALSSGSSTPSIVAVVTNINAKTVASTLLYTVPTGKTFVPYGVIVRATAATAITNGPTADINTSSLGDIYAPTGMSALTAVGKTFTYGPYGMSTSVPAAGTVNFNITGAATGTSETVTVTLLGILQ